MGNDQNLQRPLYGRRLLPCVLDDEAQARPHRVFASFARSNDLSQGFQDVSFQQVANAVNYLAYKLQAVFGPKPDREFETLTYIGLPDIRYSVVVYAAVKCGYKVLLPSPRNPTSTNAHLMEKTGCSKILHAKEVEVEALVEQLARSKSGAETVTIEALADLLEAQAPSFPYNPSFKDAVRHPIVVLHSSGSTGLPKPVVMTHGTFAVMDNDRNFPTVPGRKNHDLTVWDFDGTPGRIYAPFPPSHLAGFHTTVMLPLYTSAIPIFGPSSRPVSGALVAEIMLQQKIRGCILPPSVAEQVLHEPNGLELFKRLDIFSYTGGPLSLTTGDAISRVTMVCQVYGSTETGLVRQLVPQRENWSYMEFHPNAKLEFRQSDDDALELVLFADPATEDSVPLNHNYPGLREWHTKDLFKQHPTSKKLWRFHGRKDDILVLSSGEKLNPLPMENQLQGSNGISGALVIGRNRFQPALLLEMKKSNVDEIKALDQIWPIIESANTSMPGYGRVVRAMVLFAKADKPFVRAGKGTIVRKLTENAYAHEIDDLYSGSQRNISREPPSLLATAFSLDAVDSLIRSILPPTIRAGTLKGSDDLYVSGLDSLKTVEAVNTLKSSLSTHRAFSDLMWLSAETFYDYPTINQLSNIVLIFLNQGAVPQKKDRIAKMSDMLEHYASSLKPGTAPPSSDPKPRGLSIALTGTTGTLGPYLLEELCRSPTISRIFCLNRSPTAKQQWYDKHPQCIPGNPSDAAQLVFLTVDYGREDLGLDYHDHSSIAKECDLIIHNAWKVDFNQDLSSFADNIRSVQTFANWSSSNYRRPRIIFVSSISSVGPWNAAYNNDLGIPEAPIENLGASLSIGYGESKQVAERLLDRAATEHGVPVSILRVGQIGGAALATHAKWTQLDLAPSMVKTSKSIGLIPADLPPVNWIPVDVVSKIVAELAFVDLSIDAKTPKYYHVINPQPLPWYNFIPSLLRHCDPGAQVVPLSQWIEKLQTFDSTDVSHTSSKPALRMMKFFSLIASNGPFAKYQTLACVQASKTMASLGPVNETMMQNWLSQSA